MRQSNNTIIGALAVGIAITGGAYLAKNFGNPTNRYAPEPGTESTLVATIPTRQPIAEVDTNNDGIPDWREQVLSSAQIITANASTSYSTPDTLTAQVAVGFFQNYVNARGYGAFGATPEEVIEDTVDQLGTYASDTMLDSRDVQIGTDDSPQAIRIYANAMALAISEYGVEGLEGEVPVLQGIVQQGDFSRLSEIETIARIYKNTLEKSKQITVPPILLKEHLDILNIYNALYNDALGMTQIQKDPVATLIRLKRFEDDSQGAALAFQNLYLALEPYGSVFKENDPALRFVIFNPNL